MQVAVWTSTGSSAGPPGCVRARTEQTLRRRELDVPRVTPGHFSPPWVPSWHPLGKKLLDGVHCGVVSSLRAATNLMASLCRWPANGGVEEALPRGLSQLLSALSPPHPVALTPHTCLSGCRRLPAPKPQPPCGSHPAVGGWRRQGGGGGGGEGAWPTPSA